MGKNRQKNRLPVEQMQLVDGFEPKTDNQKLLVNHILNKDVIIANGSSGVGKTYVALATALKLLNEGYKRIILVKSVTTIPGENIGYVPGDKDEKMKSFIMSFTWTIDKICHAKGVSEDLIRKGLIEVMPIAYVRGLSIDDSIVIIDEVQNIDSHTFKTLISRIGINSKYIFLGDSEQIDRRVKTSSCLEEVIRVFRHMPEYVGIVQFKDDDCVRNPIIPKILEELRIAGI